MTSFEVYPGCRLRGQPVPDDLGRLMHKCTGSGCTFCAWRKTTPFELGWERLLEENSETSNCVCGVQLTSSQIADPFREISTQQTSDFLANFDIDDRFPQLDSEFEKILSQVDSSILCGSSAVTTSSTTATTSRSYASPKGEKAVQAARANSIPAKTRDQTDWVVRVWTDWATSRNNRLLPGEEPFSTDFCELTVSEMNFWLSRFVLEVRKRNGDPYPPNTLYQLTCGLQRQLREHGCADIKLFDNPALHHFRSALDGEMKQLNSTGKYIQKKQAQPITIEQENRLWELGLLGDHSPRVLLNTLVYQVGFFFALRSGNEHRRLRHSPPQIQLFEPPNDRAYLVYQEDISKTNQGGLSNRRKQPKEVYHYSNEDDSTRCFIRLFKLYNSKCPEDRPPGALYLTPLSRPRGGVWYSKTPLGHNILGKVVTDMMKEAGYEGHYTNHSLRASLATRLYDAEMDEQLIMSRTGHSSTEGVRAYKRASTKLKQVTSDVLNNPKRKPLKELTVAQPEPESPKPESPKPILESPKAKRQCKENQIIPSFHISGGTNITINIKS